MGKIDDHIRDVLQSHKDELYERYHVESLSVFSSVSRGTARPDSDIDIHLVQSLFFNEVADRVNQASEKTIKFLVPSPGAGTRHFSYNNDEIGNA